ncbi:MAG TPA: magnesium chelatase, partial [Bryobacteraceae bacterium]
LLDKEIPVLAGCEINDSPIHPICKSCSEKIQTLGDKAEIAWIGREQRYAEKLATPDVTIADLIGEVDPIKVAEGRYLSDELTIHYGLIPRTNRGIFAINELPDLGEKIQVGLFNIMQEGDVQIKGYPVRLPLDVMLVFTANPEDYTARGKIITPLKDRIGSEIRTHYPAAAEHGIAITRQESWTDRGGAPVRVQIPEFIREIVEQVAFHAREDKRVDKRSGVSQRLPISMLENVVSNAERRALRAKEALAVPRVLDVYAALPAITGKLELEYEGELKGGDAVARELIRSAVGKVFSSLFENDNLSQVVQWFDLGGSLKLDENADSASMMSQLASIQGLTEKLGVFRLTPKDPPALRASAAEFVLEGLYAHRRIARNEERGFAAEERKREAHGAGGESEPKQRSSYRRQFN